MQDFSVATGAEREGLAPLLSHAFGFPAADVPSWFERAGADNLRAYREGGALVGGLISIPMGQHFGGNPVSMTGVAGVGVAPQHRGRGACTRMMRALVREIHDAGVALSTLYPASVPLYQRSGYERAGACYTVAVNPRDLPTARHPALRVEPLDALGDDTTRALHSRFARTRNGYLERGPYLWARLNRPYKGEPRFHGIVGPDGMEGYVAVIHKQADGHDTELAVTDLVAVTPRAAQEALALLGAYRSLAGEARWSGAPHDVFSVSLRDRFHEIRLQDYWMVRVTHVERALAQRGYNPMLRGALTLTVTDDAMPENGGAWRLEVEDGEAKVSRASGSGAPSLSLDVRSLAAMYTGFRQASSLARDGLAEGDARSLALADALFAGEAPAMGDAF